jgi:LPXTG-motif cell wall-anchored protein
VVDAGPIEITADKKESVALPPLAGLALVAGGAFLLMKR